MSDDHASGVGLKKTEDVLQRDGFSHPTSSQNADRLGILHIEGDIVEHALVPECL